MNNVYIIGLIISLLFTFVSYIATNNYFISLLLFLITFSYFIFRVNRCSKKYRKEINKITCAYTFINNCIISLRIPKNVESACKITFENFNVSLIDGLGDVNELTNYEKTKYLGKIFKLKVYNLFLNILEIYLDNGGDILNMSSYLLNKVQNIESYIISINNYSKKKVIEFIILWSFSISIIIFLRFALKDFVPYLIKSPIYCWGIFIFFIFLLFSLEILIRKILNIGLKGEKYE